MTVVTRGQTLHRMQSVAVGQPGKRVEHARLIANGIDHERASFIPADGVSQRTVGEVLGVLTLVQMHGSPRVHELVMNQHDIFFLSYLHWTTVTP